MIDAVNEKQCLNCKDPSFDAIAEHMREITSQEIGSKVWNTPNSKDWSGVQRVLGRMSEECQPENSPGAWNLEGLAESIEAAISEEIAPKLTKMIIDYVYREMILAIIQDCYEKGIEPNDGYLEGTIRIRVPSLHACDRLMGMW